MLQSRETVPPGRPAGGSGEEANPESIKHALHCNAVRHDNLPFPIIYYLLHSTFNGFRLGLPQNGSGTVALFYDYYCVRMYRNMPNVSDCAPHSEFGCSVLGGELTSSSVPIM